MLPCLRFYAFLFHIDHWLMVLVLVKLVESFVGFSQTTRWFQTYMGIQGSAQTAESLTSSIVSKHF